LGRGYLASSFCALRFQNEILRQKDKQEKGNKKKTIWYRVCCGVGKSEETCLKRRKQQINNKLCRQKVEGNYVWLLGNGKKRDLWSGCETAGFGGVFL
jgi:hypothetical protein